jgi:hypothetical protein
MEGELRRWLIVSVYHLIVINQRELLKGSVISLYRTRLKELSA